MKTKNVPELSEDQKSLIMNLAAEQLKCTCFPSERKADAEESDEVEEDFNEDICGCLQCLLFQDIERKHEYTDEDKKSEETRKRLQKRLDYMRSFKVQNDENKNPETSYNAKTHPKNEADLQKPTKINLKSLENVVKYVEGPEVKPKKQLKKVTPQQKLDEYLAELEDLNEKLSEVNLDVKQTQNQLTQLRETNGKNKKKKMATAQERFKEFTKCQSQIEKEVKAVVSNIKGLKRGIEVEEHCKGMSAVMALLVPPKPKENDETKVEPEGQQLYKMIGGEFVPVPTESVKSSTEAQEVKSPEVQEQDNAASESKQPVMSAPTFAPSYVPYMMPTAPYMNAPAPHFGVPMPLFPAGFSQPSQPPLVYNYHVSLPIFSSALASKINVKVTGRSNNRQITRV